MSASHLPPKPDGSWLTQLPFPMPCAQSRVIRTGRWSWGRKGIVPHSCQSLYQVRRMVGWNGGWERRVSRGSLCLTVAGAAAVWSPFWEAGTVTLSQQPRELGPLCGGSPGERPPSLLWFHTWEKNDVCAWNSLKRGSEGGDPLFP